MESENNKSFEEAKLNTVEEKLSNRKKGKKNKNIRSTLVLIAIVLVGLFIFFIERGQYLYHLDAGSQFVKLYQTRQLEKLYIFSIVFLISYFSIFFITKRMHKNLEELFEEEGKTVSDLPTKSISLIFALIVAFLAQLIFAGDFLKLFNIAWFGKKDFVLGLDYSYYIIVMPIIRKILYYLIAFNISALLYILVYGITIINTKLGGIEFKRLLNSKIVKQIINVLTTLVIIVSITIFANLPNAFVSDMFKTEGKESFYLTGASLTDIYIKLIGFAILPFLIIFSFFKLKKNIKNDNKNKIFKTILIVPVYILLIYILIFVVQIVWINRNKLEYESKYIRQNISETKTAFGIKTDENIIEKSEILSSNALIDSQEFISTIPMVNPEIVLQTLNEQDTNLKIYKYNSPQLAKSIYNEEELEYFTPREIDSRKSTNGSTDYTHGFFGIITDANTMDSKGGVRYISREYENPELNGIRIEEPRIYYGLETNSVILTKTKSGPEFDFPITTSKTQKNTYNGAGGLNLKFLDRLIIGTHSSAPTIIASTKIKEDTKVLFNRNIINRVEKILPEIRYDRSPYMVASEEGRLLWVIDGYTTTERYPYSQKFPLPTDDNRIRKVNYIKNSVKVLIDAYDGTMTFYIDKSDPMILNIDNIFDNTFKSIDEIPIEISSQFRYPKFLYDVQSEVVRKYHTNENDIFFSGDDVWEFSLLNEESNRIREKTLNYTVFKNTDEDSVGLGYLTAYTPYSRQNINAYLVGKYNNGKPELKLYQYSRNDNIPGIQLIKTQIRSEDLIREELEELNVIGTEVKSYPMLIPINNSMLYVEPVYQVYINRNNHVVLKKVIVANGSRVGIGNNIQSAIANLFSDLAINIDIHDPLDRELIIEAIIRTNIALEKAIDNKNLETIGKHTKELNSLINQLKKLDEEINKKITIKNNKESKDKDKKTEKEINNKINNDSVLIEDIEI